MPKKAVELTDRQVKAKKAIGLHAVGGVPGLLLQITTGGGRSWVYRYKLGSNRRNMGLGPCDAIGLAEARERAREARRLVLAGDDPIERRRAERLAKAVDAAKAMTFGQAAQSHIQAHQTVWRNAEHRRQWTSSLEQYVYPAIGKLPVAAIDTALVMQVLEPIWSTKTETASRVRGRIESVLDWATSRQYRTGENPARWKGHLAHMLPAPSKAKRAARTANGGSEHHAALDYRQMGVFMAELRSRAGLTARALEFVILTCARAGEVLGATWREIDLEGRTWRVPSSRMKGGRDHVVPLSGAALAVLRALPMGDPDDRPFKLDVTTITRLTRRLEHSATTHGFRSTFSDWAAEMTAFPSEVREMALAHTVGNKVEAAYRRGDLFDKRRQIMDAWARFVEGLNSKIVELDDIRREQRAS